MEKVKWGHRAPFGYNFDHEKKTLIINPSEEKTLKIIFKMYLSGNSTRDIAIHLNDNNYTTALGGKWAYNTIENMLAPKRLEIYSGHKNGELGDWEPIINKNEYKRLLSAYVPPAQMSRPHKNQFLLTRLKIVRCGYCGGPIKSSATKRKDESIDYYYYCTSKSMYGDSACSESNLVLQWKINNALLNDIVVKMNNIAKIKTFTKKYEKINYNKFLTEINEISTKLASLIEQQIKSKSKKQFDKLQEKIDVLESRKKELIKDEKNPFDFNSLDVEKIKNIKKFGITEQKKLISNVVDKIRLLTGYAIIEYKFYISPGKKIVEIEY